MKAIRIHDHGGIDKLRYEDVPEPKLLLTGAWKRANNSGRSFYARTPDEWQTTGAREWSEPGEQ